MRVVGYYNSLSNKDVFEKLDLQALTQVNYAFLLPREDGTLYFLDEENLRHVTEIAHSRRIKVFVSIGGWSNEKKEPLNRIFEKIMDNEISRKRFIDNALDVVKTYNFDGIDFDWEFPSLSYQSALENVVSALSKKLHDLNKELSMALYFSIEGEEKYNWVEAFSDTIISKLDFVGIMTYDDTKEDNHSSLKLAVKCVDYWVLHRKVPRSKVLFGIPFYSRPSAIIYSSLIAQTSENAFRDYSLFESYNGIYTVREKTHFARLNCGGLIIWAINYDTTDEYSLLSAIASAR